LLRPGTGALRCILSSVRGSKRYQPRRGGTSGILLSLLLASAFFCAPALRAADTPAASEARVKAVFLFNFAKYVDWPAAAFPDATAPITVGVIGTDPFGDTLPHTVEGKTVNGRPFVIKHLAADSDLSGCHILFISHSEAARMGGILDKAGPLPILTVGEDEPFARNGGAINFVLKNGKVRLAINLAAARKAGLTISSKLLAVADEVKGGTN
jgi:hypothetical protein